MLDRANLRFQSVFAPAKAVAGKIAEIFTTLWTKNFFTVAKSIFETKSSRLPKVVVQGVAQARLQEDRRWATLVELLWEPEPAPQEPNPAPQQPKQAPTPLAQDSLRVAQGGLSHDQAWLRTARRREGGIAR